jgi:transposase
MNSRNRCRPKHGKPHRFKLGSCRKTGSAVERFSAWLTGGLGRLALRWKKLASNFQGFIQLACIMMYLRVFR